MKAALLSLALLGTDLMVPVSDRIPELKVEALCKARSAQDRIMRFPESSEDPADCVREETDAKQKLGTLWGSTSSAVRGRCESDAAVLGTRSYLDLLICIQMAEDIKLISPSTTPKAARKHRATQGAR
jgi:hypothetical protein